MRITALVVLLSVVGCSEWPRVANVPEVGEVEDAAVDPGDLVDLAWTAQSEAQDPNDQPTDLPKQALPRLELGTGVALTGVLDGAGWSSSLTPTPLSDNACNGGSDVGTRAPISPGDYRYDVDFVVFEINTSGTLCGAAQATAAEDVAFDLTPHRVNPCNVPLAILSTSEGEQVDVEITSGSGSWAANVEVPANETLRVAVGIGAFGPENAPDLDVQYEAALSLVPPQKDGSEGVCPTPPWEAE